MRPSVVALTLALLLPLPGLAADVVVKPGETLSEIAERHGVSLSRLMELNGIRNADHVEEGQRLRLPGSAAPTATRTARSSGGSGAVVVQPGETLSEIAEREGLSVARLMQINGLQDADLVQAGQTLRVRGSGSTVATAAPTTYPRGATSHTVRPGESLSQIADGYGVPVSRLVAINSLSDPNHLVSGSRLQLTGPVAAAPVTSRPAPVAKPRPQTPVATATPRVKATPTSSAPARTTVAAASTSPTTGARSDWRSYGPLQVDWANWQPMGGSYVAPTLNRDGAALYTAINCGARKLNATTPSGQWKSWDEPRSDDEQQLVRDLCSSRGN
ncbi:MAG: LysM peptidoglycan-binding domain-containing protein [Cyanobacteriota bacterium]|nr:LysM peptidoglycan-binding domain-containing protein [Cyanobacteriota bacterium]